MAFAWGLTLGMLVVSVGLSPPRWGDAQAKNRFARSEPTALAPGNRVSPVTQPPATAPRVAGQPMQSTTAQPGRSATQDAAVQTAPSPGQIRQRTAADQSRPGAVASVDRPAGAGARKGRFRGSLAIKSDPEGARVTLNGVAIGTTPLVLQDLPVGSRVIRVHHDGYEAWSSGVTVIADQRTNVMALLAPDTAP